MLGIEVPKFYNVVFSFHAKKFRTVQHFVYLKKKKKMKRKQ